LEINPGKPYPLVQSKLFSVAAVTSGVVVLNGLQIMLLEEEAVSNASILKAGHINVPAVAVPHEVADVSAKSAKSIESVTVPAVYEVTLNA